LEGQELAARHIELRGHAGLTQEQEAKRAGVSPTTISGIESGKITRPHLKTLLKIARALGVDVGELRESGKAGAPSSPAQQPLNGFEEERRDPKLANASREAGLADADSSGKLTAAMALEEIAELWAEQLARGFYDVRTLNKMRVAAYVLAQYHEGAARKHRENLPPNFRAQLEAAEERLAEVVAQIWDLEEVGSDYPMSRGESAAKRKAKREELLQRLRGSVQTKASSRIGA
jgi:transcriptional regulator with XRE-family HTH domain